MLQTQRSLYVIAIAFMCSGAFGQPSFVNWETPHTHPLAITPDGLLLLAVNTADNRLEVFDLSLGTPITIGSVPVGLDPVTVRARTHTEAWVVNTISDSISIVNLATMNVVKTLSTGDSPRDVVFTGSRAFVSCSQVDRVQVFDLTDLNASPIDLPIIGQRPRAMALSPDGATVYVAIFESGNATTILGGGATAPNFFPPNVVSDPAGPYGGQNPPPNDGDSFTPPINPELPTPPPAGLIVRKDDQGQWLDDNAGDWTDLVSGKSADLSGRPFGWDVYDHDVAVIDAQSLDVSYITRLMNLCMAIAVNPATGRIGVVGTDGTNEVRFEPNLNGRFLRTQIAMVEAAADAATVLDLNPHLSYDRPSVPMDQRVQSIGDPRAIIWNSEGTLGYVAGMGSDIIVRIDESGVRTGSAPIAVGQGPTGLALDEARSRLYVLNKFDGSISIINTNTHTEVHRVSFFDPTPAVIKQGRPHLYDTHATSGLGHISCASCHPDGRMDRLAWDLGDPSAEMIPFDQNCNFGASTLGGDPCPDWHPMKGPMVTQTLQDIIGKEPHHWRGDRDGIEEFNQTFTDLQGADRMLSAQEMQDFEDFLATLTFPPNPFRNLNNSLPTHLPLPGQYSTGIGTPAGTPLDPGNAAIAVPRDFRNHHLVQGFAVSCSFCHTLPTGMATNFFTSDGNGGGQQPYPTGPNGELHHAVVFSHFSETPSMSIKVPHLRNLHEKVGFEMTQTRSLAGFGFLHDGSVDSLARFMGNPPFRFDLGADAPPAELVRDMVALMMSISGSNMTNGGIPFATPPTLSRDSHAAVGQQVTFDGSGGDMTLLNNLMTIADAPPPANTPGPRISLVAKGIRNGLPRGFAYVGSGMFRPDRQMEPNISAAALAAGAAADAEITFTAVPLGTQIRIGIDRDGDGVLDRDEIDAGSDPADPNSVPGSISVPGDVTGDGAVGVPDLLAVINAWGSCPAPPSPCPADIAPHPNGDGTVGVADLLMIINNWG